MFFQHHKEQMNTRSVALYVTSSVEGPEKNTLLQRNSKQPTQNAQNRYTLSCVTFESFSGFQLQD